MTEYRRLSMLRVIALLLAEFAVTLVLGAKADPAEWVMAVLGPLLGYLAVATGLLYKRRA